MCTEEIIALHQILILYSEIYRDKAIIIYGCRKGNVIMLWKTTAKNLPSTSINLISITELDGYRCVYGTSYMEIQNCETPRKRQGTNLWILEKARKILGNNWKRGKLLWNLERSGIWGGINIIYNLDWNWDIPFQCPVVKQ